MNKRRWIGCKKLTKADILKVEDCIKTRLPEDYRNQIIKINNGALQRAYYSTKDLCDTFTQFIDGLTEG